MDFFTSTVELDELDELDKLDVLLLTEEDCTADDKLDALLFTEEDCPTGDKLDDNNEDDDITEETELAAEEGVVFGVESEPPPHAESPITKLQKNSEPKICFIR